MKNELLKKIGNVDLKLAVAEAPDKVKADYGWVDNPLFSKISQNLGRIELKVENLNEKGLFYKNKDIYIYYGKGGVKVEETPKGIRKMLVYLSGKYNRKIIISDGVIYPGDTLNVSIDGVIDDVSIVKDPKTMLEGGNITAPYAIITILNNNDEVVTKKFITMPRNEYLKAMELAGNVKYSYPSMMSTKMVMKRALTQVYSLIGVGIDREDTDSIDDMIENQDIDTDSNCISDEQITHLEKELDILEASHDRFLKYMKINNLNEIKQENYRQALNAIIGIGQNENT